MGDILDHPDPLTGETSVPSGEGVGGFRPPLQAQYVRGTTTANGGVSLCKLPS
jgi:hypothetical protein